MKHLPTIAAVLVQQGPVILLMEFVHRDLFMASGVGLVVGLGVYYLLRSIQARGGSGKLNT